VSDTTSTIDGETEAAAPPDELREGMLAAFTEGLGDAVVGSHIIAGRELWVRVRREAWADAAELAKSKLACGFFDFLSAIDWMPSPWGRYEYAVLDAGLKQFDPTAPITTGYAGGDTRFQVFCRLANQRRPSPEGVVASASVILKADLPDDDHSIASLVPLFAGANWHERECWEMFGITFDGHPGLRHIYLPGAFEGHPLRKDFPLLARLVKPWPGIVDVEPMPAGPEDEAGEGETNGDGTAEEAADA
jgi:NADH-quinone oxidoreductase subunit C